MVRSPPNHDGELELAGLHIVRGSTVPYAAYTDVNVHQHPLGLICLCCSLLCFALKESTLATAVNDFQQAGSLVRSKGAIFRFDQSPA